MNSWTLTCCCLVAVVAPCSASDAPSVDRTASEVNSLLEASEPAFTEIDVVDDATFLRRASLDILGRTPTPGEITLFGLDPSSEKRALAVRRMLESEDYAAAWSRYWRDVIFRRATNMRAGLARVSFEEWMRENLRTNRSWDDIATELLTATGEIDENGATALIFVHEGEPEEVAAEASRIFMGIQIQCANCHDHPWDQWKREEFHQFAAYFPRMTVRRSDPDLMYKYAVGSTNRDPRRGGVSEFLLSRIDRNRDGFISKSESTRSPFARQYDRVLENADTNKDGKLSIAEIKKLQPQDNNRPGQGAAEHYMVDLSDPSSRGKKIDPAFFVNGKTSRSGMDDTARRQAAADLMTDPSNPWFARSIVNRMWYELTGSAFYLPIDDIGPDRTAEHEQVLETLCQGFVASGHDLRWLIETITGTNAYQRVNNPDAEGFARSVPTRVRADQLYESLIQALNVEQLPLQYTGRRGPGMQSRQEGDRLQFNSIFGFDPSENRSELTGSIPEALFLMNSPAVSRLLDSRSPASTVGRISREFSDDRDAIGELFLVSLGREPTDDEESIARQHVRSAQSRNEGLEDVLWSLINSTEFQARR